MHRPCHHGKPCNFGSCPPEHRLSVSSSRAHRSRELHSGGLLPPVGTDAATVRAREWVAPIIAANSATAHVANTTIGRNCWKSRKYAAFRSAVTVAPEGSHCETKANGRGRSGGATAPPLELL